MEGTTVSLSPELLQAAKIIATLGGMRETIHISSKELACMLGTSQQTAANRLISCAREGIVERRLSSKGQYVKLTQKGCRMLQGEYADYVRIFEDAKRITMLGKVISGLGEGKYYVGQKGYHTQFEAKLHFSPFPGTFNLKLSPNDVHKIESLRSAEGIAIAGFNADNRTFGDVMAFLATIRGVECAIIMPMRSHYTDVIEVISEANLRKTLGVNDGDEIEIVVKL